MADEQLQGEIVFGANTDGVESDVEGLISRLKDVLADLKIGDGKGIEVKGPSAVGIGVTSGITTALTQTLLRGLGKSISSLTGLIMDTVRTLTTASPSLQIAFDLFGLRMRLLALDIGERLAPAVRKMLDIAASFIEKVNFDLVAEKINEFALTVLPRLGEMMDKLSTTIGNLVAIAANPELSTLGVLQAARQELIGGPVAAEPESFLSSLFKTQRQLSLNNDALFPAGQEPKAAPEKTPAPTEQKANASGSSGVIDRANELIFGSSSQNMIETANKAIEQQRRNMIEAERIARFGRIGLTPGLDY